MIAVVQRVTEASVTVDGEVVGAIGPGLCVLVGVATDDSDDEARRLADKLWGLRVFDDDGGRMNLSASDLGLPLLVVSQFTLQADTSKGRRPSYVAAAPGPVAEPLVEAVIRHLAERGATVASGRFGADMTVALSNDGPVTLIVEISRRQ